MGCCVESLRCPGRSKAEGVTRANAAGVKGLPICLPLLGRSDSAARSLNGAPSRQRHDVSPLLSRGHAFENHGRTPMHTDKLRTESYFYGCANVTRWWD